MWRTNCLLHVQEHDGLIERWKRKAMDNILELHNKTPVWNDGQTQLLFIALL